MEFINLVSTIDTHTDGQSTRIITSGLPPILGKTMAEKMVYFRENLDYVRRALMLEPRGHNGMFGCVLTEPTLDEADYGVIFMDSGGYMSMCGMAIIGVCKVLVELGMLKTQEPFTRIGLDSPSGLVEGRVRYEKGRAESVSFRNVPAYAEYLDVGLDVAGFGTLKVDVAFGGNYFVFFSAEEAHVEVSRENIDRVIDAGIQVIEAANQKLPVRHPELHHVNSIYVATIIDGARNPRADYRNVHIFSDGQFGRSSGGTGTSARMAVLYAKGHLKLNEEMWVESITGGLFGGQLLQETMVGSKKAVVPEIMGSSFITGFHQFVIDPEDPLGCGFLIR